MTEKPLTVAWISYFPVDWLPDPPPAARIPKQHPAPWQRTLAAELGQHPGLRLHVLITRKQFPHDLTFVRDGVTFHCLKAVGGLRAPSLFWTDTLRLRRALATIAPDLVHAWGTESGAALVASRLGRPYLVTIQGLLGWLGTQVKLGWYPRFLAHLENLSLRRATRATAESPFSAGLVRRFWPHLDVQRIDVAPGWEFHRVVRRPPTGRIRLLAVSALNHAKGGDLLLQAFGALRTRLGLELTVVGHPDPACVAAVRGLVPPGTLEAVQFRPNLTSMQVAEELAATTLAVCPTRADTGPMFAKEAVIAGVPLLGSRMGGMPDYVTPGQNGFLFAVGDAAGLTTALEQACHHPDFQTGSVDTALLSRLRQELSPATYAQNFHACYHSALAATKQRPGSACSSSTSASR